MEKQTKHSITKLGHLRQGGLGVIKNVYPLKGGRRGKIADPRRIKNALTIVFLLIYDLVRSKSTSESRAEDYASMAIWAHPVTGKVEIRTRNKLEIRTRNSWQQAKHAGYILICSSFNLKRTLGSLERGLLFMRSPYAIVRAGRGSGGGGGRLCEGGSDTENATQLQVTTVKNTHYVLPRTRITYLRCILSSLGHLSGTLFL